MDVTLLHFAGCPSWELAEKRVATLAEELGFEISRREVATLDEARRLRFRGSPTILVDGRDVFADDDEPVGLSCRVYQTPDGPAGAPTMEQLRAALA